MPLTKVQGGLIETTTEPIILGAGSSTGTASQPLQVTGGAYVSGSVGIGTTNPTAKLQVRASEISSFGISAAPNNGTASASILNVSGDGKLNILNDDQISAGLGTLVNNGSTVVLGGKFNSSIPTANLSFGAIGAYKENNTSANQQGYLSLYSRPSSGDLVERVRITSSGDVGIGTTNPGAKLHVSGGNIRVDSGYGIDFSLHPNGASVESEILKDYERGTWTPYLESLTGTDPVLVYSQQNANYIKIGDLVYVEFVLVISSVTSNGAGNIGISGLPFASSSNSYSTNFGFTYNDVFDTNFRDGYASGSSIQVVPAEVTQSNAIYNSPAANSQSYLSTGYLSGSGFYYCPA